jgi:hypothetical protein
VGQQSFTASLIDGRNSRIQDGSGKTSLPRRDRSGDPRRPSANHDDLRIFTNLIYPLHSTHLDLTMVLMRCPSDWGSCTPKVLPVKGTARGAWRDFYFSCRSASSAFFRSFRFSRSTFGYDKWSCSSAVMIASATATRANHL